MNTQYTQSPTHDTEEYSPGSNFTLTVPLALKSYRVHNFTCLAKGMRLVKGLAKGPPGLNSRGFNIEVK